jgi:acetyl-CoA synthetase
MHHDNQDSPGERVAQLLALYDTPDACAAELLCDDRDGQALAYRILRSDGPAEDLTYGALKAESERFAAALFQLGVRPGDRVATLMGKSREYLVTLMGIWRLGAVHVPLFTAFAPPAIAYRLTGSGAKLVVCDGAQQEKLSSSDMPSDPPWQVVSTADRLDGLSFTALVAAQQAGFPAARLGGDAAFINIYTSGTTGKPKGVVVPLRALASFRAYCEFALDLRTDDLYWCAADPGWAYGLYYGILAAFTTGTRSLLVEGGFVAERTLAILAEQKVTNFAAAPTIYRGLLNADTGRRPPIQLRCVSSAGEPLTPDVNDWAVRALGVPVHDHYGQTETGMLVNNHHHPQLKRPLKAGSMGHAMPGWHAVVLHDEKDAIAPTGTVGRLAMEQAESPLAWFTGYDRDPAKSAEKFAGQGRWYVTGDTAKIDDEGYVHFSARDDDVIIMAGYRIGPFEVESALSSHPAVAESAVIAAPDTIRGEVLEAYVVLCPGHEPSDELARDLQRWVKDRFAAHAYPRVVHFADELPKTPSGKIQRFVLKQRRREELAAQPAVST